MVISAKLPQIDRKQALSDLLGENGIELPIIYSEHLTIRAAEQISGQLTVG
jgi:hypothetical protein